MTSKITAIVAAAVVLASTGVASAQTNRHAGASMASALRQLLLQPGYEKSALRARQTTTGSTRWLGRCLMELRRTKFCAALHYTIAIVILTSAAVPSAAAISSIHTVDAGMTMRLTGSLIEHLQRWIARHKMAFLH